MTASSQMEKKKMKYWAYVNCVLKDSEAKNSPLACDIITIHGLRPTANKCQDILE
jgi:hypothetical protein